MQLRYVRRRASCSIFQKPGRTSLACAVGPVRFPHDMFRLVLRRRPVVRLQMINSIPVPHDSNVFRLDKFLLALARSSRTHEPTQRKLSSSRSTRCIPRTQEVSSVNVYRPVQRVALLLLSRTDQRITSQRKVTSQRNTLSPQTSPQHNKAPGTSIPPLGTGPPNARPTAHGIHRAVTHSSNPKFKLCALHDLIGSSL